MKRLSIICMAALIAMAAACKKEKETESDGTGFRATVESQSSGSKTYLDGTSIKWNKGDEILVVNNNNESGHFVTQDEGTTSANFNSKTDLPDGFYDAGQFTAYYPASIVDVNDGTFTLPSTQQAVFEEQRDGQSAAYQATFGNGANPMVAQSTTTSLKFKNLCGILQLQLYNANGCYVKSITITSKDDEEMLCGTGTVNWENTDGPVLEMTTGTNSVTLECTTASGSKDGTSDGVPLGKNETDATSFFIVVPVGTLGKGFKVTVNGNDCLPLDAPASGGSIHNTIGRNEIKPMPVIDVLSRPDGAALPGLFSVSATKQVYFSKGNLWYDKNGTGGKYWNFEAKQYSYRTYSGSNGTPANTYGLFGWGDVPADGSNIKTSTSDNDYKKWTDWGTKIGDYWRTLKGPEWDYLLTKRSTTSGKRYAKASVNGVYGIIILPDDWNTSTYSLSNYDTPDAEYTSNTISASNWSILEEKSCVFLPSVGYREGATVYYGNGHGRYWSSTDNGADNLPNLLFNDTKITPEQPSNRHFGFCVRLVYGK